MQQPPGFGHQKWMLQQPSFFFKSQHNSCGTNVLCVNLSKGSALNEWVHLHSSNSGDKQQQLVWICFVIQTSNQTNEMIQIVGTDFIPPKTLEIMLDIRNDFIQD
jgi:hypothetical protein